MWTALAAAAFSVASVCSQDSIPPGKNPIELDRTGVRWAPSFDEARKRAASEQRLMLVLPDNYAPTGDGSFGFEIFRVAALCDERVAALVEQRFVPCYFNVFEYAAAYDAKAREMVVREKRQLGQDEQTFVGGLPVLLMTPGGDVVHDFPSAIGADEVLAHLQKALKKNSAFNVPSKAEKDEGDALVRARKWFALQQYDKARAELKKDARDDAQLLLARMARAEAEWKEHERVLRALKAPERAGDVALERAWRHWMLGELDQAFAGLAAVPETSARRDEALYLTGVVRFHMGKKEDALATWKELIEKRPLGPWVYRADWASCEVQRGHPSEWKSGVPPPTKSLLGHGDYLGGQNPDLVPRNGKG